jgi:hypothetical protein
MEAKTLSFVLSPAAVDEISSLTAEVLGKYGVDKTDAIRMRLSVEEVLLIWLDALGEGVKCTFRSGKRLGRQYINVSVAGAKVDPLKVQEESGEFVANTDINILASLGLAPDYQYANGENRVTLMPNKKKLNPMIMLGAAIVLGVISGLLGLLLPVEIRTVLADDILAPLFNAFTGLLTALAGPMMFLSVIWSIYNIGDVALNLNNIDTQNGYVKVTGKGGKERIVPMGKKACLAVDKYLPLRQKSIRKDPNLELAVFLNKFGQRLTARSVRNIINKYVQQVALNQKVSPHTLRHTFATHLLNGGADLRSVQELLGHVKLSTTQVYTHVTTERIKSVHDKNHPRR